MLFTDEYNDRTRPVAKAHWKLTTSIARWHEHVTLVTHSPTTERNLWRCVRSLLHADRLPRKKPATPRAKPPIPQSSTGWCTSICSKKIRRASGWSNCHGWIDARVVVLARRWHGQRRNLQNLGVFGVSLSVWYVSTNQRDDPRQQALPRDRDAFWARRGGIRNLI